MHKKILLEALNKRDTSETQHNMRGKGKGKAIPL
jgi:hypothetical protein